MALRGECIGVVSGKGGTGKTSFVAGVGTALAMSGKRVLCLDCDICLRDLDLALGLSDRAMMNFWDVVQGRCSLDAAIVEHPKVKDLYLLTAPSRVRDYFISIEEMENLLNDIRMRFDFCLLDAPGGLGFGFSLATCAADRVIVVTTADSVSLRDAQRAVMELNRFPVSAIHLVVNRVQKNLFRRMRITIDDAMDQAGLPLLGIIPEDTALPLCFHKGTLLFLVRDSCRAANAYRNIAQRLQGNCVPLFH